MEASNRPQQTDLLRFGPTGHVNPFVDIEINSLQLSSRLPTVKAPYPSSRGDTKHFPLSLSELFELSAHPIVTLFFFFNTKMLDAGLLPRSRGMNQDKL
jgi:hypothetical protein